MGAKHSSVQSRGSRTAKQNVSKQEGIPAVVFDEAKDFMTFLACDALCYRLRDVPREQIETNLRELIGQQFMGASFDGVTEHSQLLLLMRKGTRDLRALFASCDL